VSKALELIVEPFLAGYNPMYITEYSGCVVSNRNLVALGSYDFNKLSQDCQLYVSKIRARHTRFAAAQRPKPRFRNVEKEVTARRAAASPS
jgi:hypothetical protein